MGLEETIKRVEGKAQVTE